jgi:23S rRNA (uracil1939-C5)-methyltransferase
MTALSDSALRAAAPHEERITCEHADRCAGCPLIGLPYSEQLALKRGRVVQAVARYASLELVYTEPVAPAQPVVGYRTRAKLVTAPGGRVGLYARGGGHQVVDIPGCRVLAPALARVASVLRARILASERDDGPLVPHAGPSGPGSLRAVDLREVRDGDTARVLVTFVVQRNAVASLDGLRSAARELMALSSDVAGVAVNFHGGDGPQILGAETTLLAGVSSAPDRSGASMHMATYGSFVQAHRGQSGRIHAALVEALGLARPSHPPERKPRVLDLYGGSGAIALGLAAAGASVRLVESFAPAVEQARAAAARLGVDVEAQCADAATALRTCAQKGDRFDAAVVNPPRRGTSPSAREWLARLQPQVVAYVSCDPETLARDLDHFARLGYGATTLRPLDMIPLSEEVETIAVLRPAGIPAPTVVYDDAEILIVDKGPHEPTTPQGEYAGSLLARVRRLPGAERAVPVQRLDVGTSGLVTFARSPDHVAKWDRVLGAPSTRKIYVAAVRGVIPTKGTITRDLKEDGKPQAARTRYRRLAVAAGHSVVRVVPEQGRTHQIRRHLASIGFPVLGDDRYGHEPTNRFFEEKNRLDRTFLHCVRLEFDHPDGGARRVVEAPLPGDLRAVLERTSGPGTLRFLEHKNALGTTGTSHLPPGSDEILHDRGSALDIRETSPTIHPEITGDDDGRESGEY